MKHLLIGLLASMIFISCEKETKHEPIDPYPNYETMKFDYKDWTKVNHHHSNDSVTYLFKQTKVIPEGIYDQHLDTIIGVYWDYWQYPALIPLPADLTMYPPVNDEYPYDKLLRYVVYEDKIRMEWIFDTIPNNPNFYPDPPFLTLRLDIKRK